MATPRTFHFILEWRTPWKRGFSLFLFCGFFCFLESSVHFGKLHENTRENSDHISSVPWIAGLPSTTDKLSESGREQMWPTPNWLHQHSFCVLILFSCQSVLSFLQKSTLLSPLHIKDKQNNIHHCFEVDLSMCFTHNRYLKAFSIFQWMLPSVPVQIFPITWNAFPWNIKHSCQFYFCPMWFGQSTNADMCEAISEIGYVYIVMLWGYWGTGSEK